MSSSPRPGGPSEFLPELVVALRERWTRARFLADLQAGVVVGVLALPLALAFAIASGVRPEQGLITVVTAGLVISLLGGSRVQIGGPTGAFIVLVLAVVTEHGPEGLAVATLMAGVLLLVLGLARLGTLIQYIPYPVTVGFTAGIALIIAAAQLPDVLGVTLPAEAGGVIGRLVALPAALPGAAAAPVLLAVATVAIMRFAPRIDPRLPGPLIALLATTAAAALLDLPVETVGSRFGEISGAIPVPSLPDLSWERLGHLFPAALAIALLGGIESLLSAVVADGMTGFRHRPNTELVAQGVANIVSPLFGGLPATGAIARTATNVRAGGRSPVAGVIHAVTLLAIMLFLGRWAGLVPLATLGGILLVVAINMSEHRLVLKVFRSTRGDALVLATTFVLTVVVDLTVAIEVGVVLSALLFMRRMVDLTQVRPLRGVVDDAARPAHALPAVPAGVEIYEVNGPFFFGAAHKFVSTLSRVDRRVRVLVLDLQAVTVIDATALHALEGLCESGRRDGVALVLSGASGQPREVLERSGLLQRLGLDNVTADLRAAIAASSRLLRGASPPSPPPVLSGVHPA